MAKSYTPDQFKTAYENLLSQKNQEDAARVKAEFIAKHPKEAEDFFSKSSGWAQFKVGAAKGLLGLGEALDVVDLGKLLPGGADFSKRMAEARRKSLSQYETPLPPATMGQEWMRYAGEIAGGTAPFLPFAPISAAAKASAAGAGLLRAGGAGVRSLLGEIIPAVGATSGGASAQTLFPDNELANITGQVLGGAPGTLARIALGAGRKALGRAGGDVKEELTRQAVQGAEAAYGAVPPDAVARGQTAAEAIGLPTTLAEKTGSQELLDIQRRLVLGGDVSATAEQSRAAAARQALSDYAQGKAPAFGEAEALINEAVDRTQKAIQGERAALAKTTEEAQGVAAELPEITPIETGAQIRTEILNAEKKARNEFSDLAEKLGLNKAGMFVPFKSFRDDVLSAFSGRQFAEAKDLPNETLRNISEAKSVTFKDLMDLRSNITGNIREADAANKVNLSASYKLILSKLDDMLDNSSGAFGTLADRYSQFRKAYRQNVIEPFEDKVFKATQENGRGFFVTNDEKVASLFLKGPTEARQFTAIAKNSPSMVAAMENAVLDDLRSRVATTGVIDQAKLMKWLRDNNTVLNELPPSIKSKILNVQQRNAALIARADSITQNVARIEDTYLAKAGKKILGDKPFSFDNLTAEVLGNPKAMSSLVADLTPEARSALQRHVWDSVYNGKVNGVDFVAAHKESLSKLFPKENLEELSILADGVAQINRLPDYLVAARQAENTPLWKRALRGAGQSERAAISQWLAVQRGRSGTAQELAGAVGRFASRYGEKKAAEAMKIALYDKDAMDALKKLSSPDKKEVDKAFNWFRAWMAGLLPGALSDKE